MDCIIDISNYAIWITPEIKSNYRNDALLKFESKGQAFINAVSLPQVSKSSFEFKYYTWEQEQAPLLLLSNDDYVFMKQDDTNLPRGNPPTTPYLL